MEKILCKNSDLTAHEINLKKQKKSFIFISHKMPEIFDISDRYTVFRNGEMISSGNIKDTDPHGVTSDMVGVKFAEEDLYTPRQLGDTVVELRHVTGIGFEDINLEKEITESTAKSFNQISDSADVMNGNVVRLTEILTELVSANTDIIDSIQTISGVSEEVSAHANETLDAEEDNVKRLEEVSTLMNDLKELTGRL